MKRLYGCIPLIFLLTTLLFSQQDRQFELRAVRIDRPLDLTGMLSDPLWKTTTPVELPYEFQPGENTPAPQKTEVVALYDEEHLYLGFRCYDDDPQSIRANLSDRDRIFSDDYVIVVIDTYGDYQRGYELVLNPYDIQADLMMSSGNEDLSFKKLPHSFCTLVDHHSMVDHVLNRRSHTPHLRSGREASGP